MSGNRGLFREEALRHYLDRRQWGDVLRLPPAWTRWTYPFLLAVFAAALAFAATGSIRRDLTGPAVLRTQGQRDLTASIGASRVIALAFPGERVAPGRAVARLIPPVGPSQVLRAPVGGIVRHITLEPRFRVARGERIASIEPPRAELEAFILLPAAERSHLRSGLMLRLRISGPKSRPERSLTAPIRWMADAPISRAEGARLLDLDDRAAEALSPSLVLVQAGPIVENVSGLHGGLAAQAEVTIGAEPVLFALLPGLREALGR